jgi:SSS family solute:Na+ symporter/sodium/proline symporter
LLLIGIAVYKSRTVKSADDFIIAGRSVPVYMLVATLVCTWIGSGSLFGTAGLTFRTGISELWFSAGAWVGILVIYFIAARVRRIAQYTLTDLLEKRYNQTAKVLGTITIIIAYMVIAGYQFLAQSQSSSPTWSSPATSSKEAAVLSRSFPRAESRPSKA